MKQYMQKDFENAIKRKGKDAWDAYLRMKPCKKIELSMKQKIKPGDIIRYGYSSFYVLNKKLL